MLRINKKLVILTVCVLLQACSKVDDYMLGKDNTPAPAALEPITPKAKVVEKWSVPIGGSQKNNAHLKLIPEIVGNVVYTADASGLVQAINRSNGKLLWSKNLDHGLVSGPTVAAGVIAVGTDASAIVLLKQADGSQLWQQKLSGEVLAKPVITANKIIAKTIDGNLYAFNLANGEKLWLSDHGAPSLILKASSSPVVVGNLVLVGYSDGKMDAVDIQTGRLVWRRSIAYASGASDVERLVDIDADPIVRGNVAYLASYQGYIGALSLTDGQFIWRKPASVYRNMTIDSKTIYLTDSDDIVWAINRQNGQVNWKQVALKARGLTEPVLVGDRLVVGDKTGLLHVLATQNGELISRTEVGGAITTAPSAAGNTIYVMSADGKLSRYSVG
ncbi:PQQ (pyrrolo quinoline) WD40-like repeat, enzyme repeat domain protein [Legionella maceachernii]|uniref:Outer membrane protein assembly factor BamB n=1 Tax=Legionella maceachernii TaxID=466 RepID=A0A0W0W8W3_9GAMM|nr:PQQ (pyrrolo quinoline) WD40-like repeat, enzyme repeat domain protein [Legionella maceachernii]SJZ70702.1 Beta-barrel assembly machine subunit BamB [Legionella maceachernii]SUP02307.1 Lipoprotein yfgL precursor [Legionella maceachernii]